MRIADHPYLEGIRCREDGAVWIPNGGSAGGFHWAFGSRAADGYLSVRFRGKRHRVHRLICEAFHGICPPDKTDVDHINRDREDNRSCNLRWATRAENCRNKKMRDEALVKYGVLPSDDKKAYERSYYANNPEQREKRKVRSANKSKTRKCVRFSDGSQHWIPNEEAARLLATPLNKRIFQTEDI